MHAVNVFEFEGVLAAYTQAAEEMGFKKSESDYYLEFERPKTEQKDRGEITIKLDSADNGALVMARQTKIPSWINSDGKNAWAIGAVPSRKVTTSMLMVDDNCSTFIKQDSDYMLKIELMERMAKHLPDNMFVFVPSMLNAEGKRTPAYIADNKKKYFFVMPKSAEPAAQNQ